MQTRSTTRLRSLLALVTVLFLVAACSVARSLVGGPLVTVEAHGGHCIGGECRSTITIGRDGRVTGERGGKTLDGRLTDALLQPLAGAVDATDFVAITAVPFDGVCPIAFDGQELTYTFHPVGRAAVTFSNCEVSVDSMHPLFRALEAALSAIP